MTQPLPPEPVEELSHCCTIKIVEKSGLKNTQFHQLFGWLVSDDTAGE
jgi:hypothetical protein